MSSEKIRCELGSPTRVVGVTLFVIMLGICFLACANSCLVFAFGVVNWLGGEAGPPGVGEPVRLLVVFVFVGVLTRLSAGLCTRIELDGDTVRAKRLWAKREESYAVSDIVKITCSYGQSVIAFRNGKQIKVRSDHKNAAELVSALQRRLELRPPAGPGTADATGGPAAATDQREALSSEIARFLTGQCTREQLTGSAVKVAWRTKDDTLRRLALELTLEPSKKDATTPRILEADWQYVQRTLAALRGGLEAELVSYGSWGWLQSASLLAAAGIVACAVAVPWYGWWPLLLAWVAGAALGSVEVRQDLHGHECFPYAPFRSQAQWEAHRPLLADVQAPAAAPPEAYPAEQDTPKSPWGFALLVWGSALATVPFSLGFRLKRRTKRVVLVREDSGQEAPAAQ